MAINGRETKRSHRKRRLSQRENLNGACGLGAKMKAVAVLIERRAQTRQWSVGHSRIRPRRSALADLTKFAVPPLTYPDAIETVTFGMHGHRSSETGSHRQWPGGVHGWSFHPCRLLYLSTLSSWLDLQQPNGQKGEPRLTTYEVRSTVNCIVQCCTDRVETAQSTFSKRAFEMAGLGLARQPALPAAPCEGARCGPYSGHAWTKR